MIVLQEEVSITLGKTIKTILILSCSAFEGLYLSNSQNSGESMILHASTYILV